MEEQYMTVRDARERLGLNKVKMAELLRYHVLPWEPDPVDMRQKLIPLSAIEAYEQEQERKRKRRVIDPKARKVA